MKIVATEIILLETERELDRVRAQRDRALGIIARVLGMGGMFTQSTREEVQQLEKEVLK